MDNNKTPNLMTDNISLKYYTNYSLDRLNTLRLKSTAKGFVILEDILQMEQIIHITKEYNNKFFILGGGSNILLPEFYSGLAIYNQLQGINLIEHNLPKTQLGDYAKIRVMAGVNWDYFVKYSLDHGWFGLENLSLIPGTVGASPVQNIGAYGIEAKNFIECVEAFDTKSGKFVVIQNRDCEFKYRDSIFKHEGGNHYIITAVVFKLLREQKLDYRYADINKHMALLENPTAYDLRDCIVKTRQSKLPDPALIGNVGSFFHNPILTNNKINDLRQKFSDIPVYAVDELHSKVSAGWLIDKLGLKGYREGNLGVYEKQALVIVNYTGTNTDSGLCVTRNTILDFAHMIQDKVFKQYEINLNIEPILI